MSNHIVHRREHVWTFSIYFRSCRLRGICAGLYSHLLQVGFECPTSDLAAICRFLTQKFRANVSLNYAIVRRKLSQRLIIYITLKAEYKVPRSRISSNHRCFGNFHYLVKRTVGDMGNIHHNAQAIHRWNPLLAEIA